jgi:transcriptional regulator with XRE-family HTH domain
MPACAVLDFSPSKLIAARKRAGLCLEDLADLTCRSLLTINNYERGYAPPSVQAVKGMARACGVEYADLLDETLAETDAE